jgi:protein SCO1/2
MFARPVFHFPRRCLSRFLLLLFVGLVSGTATAGIFSIPAVDLPAEIKAAHAEGRRLLVLFALSDCPECRTMEREVFSDPRVQKQFERRYRTARITVDTENTMIDLDGEMRTPLAIAQKLAVFATPSFAFFLPDGTLEYRHSGKLSADEFLRLGEFISGAIYETQSFADYSQHPAHH